MDDRTIHNPVSGETCTFVETSHESGGARTVLELEVAPGGGVPTHRHSDHDELIEVLEGEIELTIGGVARRIGVGERIVIGRRAVHSWRNASDKVRLRFRGGMTPGHPGFEMFLRVWFGLGRDGGLRPNGMPRRFGDLAMLTHWDPSILAGAKRLLAPVIRWSARRARASGHAAELVRRYGGANPPLS